MIIAHNLMSMNAQKNLNITNKGKAKVSEKLSSGYRINRAADDAAGAAISEKMRWQIRGLNQDVRNAEDGKSMLEVADGAMGEIQDLLQRMNELVIQAANDTNTAEDRNAIDREIGQLKKEINQISKNTTFNTIHVLDVPQIVDVGGADSSDTMDKLVNVPGIGNRYAKILDFSNVDSINKADLIGKEFEVSCSANCSQVFKFSFTDDIATTATVTNPGNSHSDLIVKIGINDPGITNGGDIANIIYNAVAGVQSGFGASGTSPDILIGHANGIAKDGNSLILYSLGGGPTYAPGMGEVRTDGLVSDQDLNLQVGCLAGQSIPVTLKTINSKTLGINGLQVDTFAHAGQSAEKIQAAIDKVSAHRSYFGAITNRLDYAIQGVENTSENTQAAESLLRDTDMAAAMVEYSTLNIVSQAGQSVLAQANSINQGVLKLFE